MTWVVDTYERARFARELETSMLFHAMSEAASSVHVEQIIFHYSTARMLGQKILFEGRTDRGGGRDE